MIKCYCDRCGVEIDSSNKPYIRRYSIILENPLGIFIGDPEYEDEDKRRIHLCATCTNELYKFLKGESEH